MYFEIVLFASLRCINDISLMNFSILPHGDLYMLQPLVFSSVMVFVSPLLPSRLLVVSILFYLPFNIRWLAPVLFGTAKVENFFKLANFIWK